jgi:hypothetical protein
VILTSARILTTTLFCLLALGCGGSDLATPGDPVTPGDSVPPRDSVPPGDSVPPDTSYGD